MRCLFFNDTATTEIYTLSLHDALPIYSRRYAQRRRAGCPRGGGGRHLREAAGQQPCRSARDAGGGPAVRGHRGRPLQLPQGDRKSTRLNSRPANISDAAFSLKKKDSTW